MSEDIELENLKSVLKIQILTIIPPKQPFRSTISRNDIKKSSSALHFEKFGKVPKFDNNAFFRFVKLLQISTIFKKAVQARKSSYWLDVAHAFTSYPKL